MDRREMVGMLGAGGLLSVLTGSRKAMADKAHTARSICPDAGGALRAAFGDNRENILSVKDFGAVGDGCADDTAAFLEAISQGPRGISVPAGSYMISRTLPLPSHTHLWGAGGRSIIVRNTAVTPFDMLEIRGTSHITIDDITIDGLEKLDVAVATNRFCGLRVWAGGGGEQPTDITIRNVRVDRTTSGENQSEGVRGALALEDCYDVRVHGFKGWNNRGTSIFLWGDTSQILISDCWLSGEVAPFSDTFNPGQPIGSGISGVYKGDVVISGCIAFNHGYTNISVSGPRGLISGNISYGSRLAGITIGHNSHGSEAHETVCVGNLVYDNMLDGIYCANSSNVVIADNIIKNNGRGRKRCGIRLMWGGLEGQAKITGNGNVSIRGNEIFRNEAAGIQVDWGKHHLIGENAIFENGGAGVLLNGKVIEDGSDLNDCVVKGNYVRDNATGGLVVAGNTVKRQMVVAKDNIVATEDPSVRQKYGIWSTQNCEVHVDGNIFSSNYDGLSVSKPNSAFRSNSGGKFHRIKNFQSDSSGSDMRYIHSDN